MTRNGKNGALMMVDFSKAFDVIDVTFIKKCLSKFNFGPVFQKWVTILYTNISSSVIVNGWLSETFCVLRGIRQRCPLSALLFVMAAELMANKVRDNKEIKGLDIDDKGIDLKLLQYADDTLFDVSDINSFENILIELEVFGKVAGPKLNREKTVLIWIGTACQRWSLSCFGLHWTDEPVKYLGHHIAPDLQCALKIDWENKLEKMQKLLDNWRKRNLTLFGRLTIIKSLAISQVIHLMIVDAIPSTFLIKLNSLIFKFLWKSKIEKVKRCIVTEDYCEGGIRMIDVKRQMFSFRLKWLGMFLDNTTGNWKDMCKHWFDCLGGLHLLLNCNYTDYTLNLLKLRNVPHFYIEILHAWYLINKYTSSECQTQKHIDENILWYNQDIVFEKKMLFYEDWYKSGIIYLKDIFKNGTFVSVNELFIRLKTRRSKQFLIFDYTKLQKSIPKIWINDKHRVPLVFKDHNFSIPHFVFGKSVKPVSLLSSKQWYNMISFEQIKINKCCLYWEDVLQKDVKLMVFCF